MSKRLLIVMLPGVDANAVNHLIDAGHLPHLQSYIEAGATAPLAWTPLATYSGDLMSVVTGALPYEHGAVTDRAPRSDGYGPSPLDRSHLKVVPIWEDWAALGHSVAAINWPASHATAHTDARIVSDRFFQIESIDLAPNKWPVFPQSVHPTTEIRSVKTLRVHPAELEQKISESPLASVLPESITPPDSNGAIIVSRLASQLAVGGHYLQKDIDAVILNIDILDRVGLPTSKEDADRIVRYYRLVDAALGQLLEGASADRCLALIMRPPSAALMQPGTRATGNGQVIFVSPNHTPDSLLEPMRPGDIATQLGKILEISLEEAEHRHDPESYPIDVIEPDSILMPLLTEHRPDPSPILNSTKDAHLRAQIVMEAEYFRSLTKEKGAEAALKLLGKRPTAFEELEVLYLNIAEHLIRDAQPQEARAFLDRSIDNDRATAWQLFLLANTYLLERNTTEAAGLLKKATQLDPTNEQISALLHNLSKLRSQT